MFVENELRFEPLGDGEYIAQVTMGLPQHGPLSEGECNSLQFRCNEACVRPVIARDSAQSGGSIVVLTLDAIIDLRKKDAKPLDFMEAFWQSVENIRQLFKPPKPSGVF